VPFLSTCKSFTYFFTAIYLFRTDNDDDDKSSSDDDGETGNGNTKVDDMATRTGNGSTRMAIGGKDSDEDVVVDNVVGMCKCPAMWIFVEL